jgi:cardiolipin synthase
MVSPTPPPVRHPARLSANASARDIPMHWIIFLSGYVLTWSVIPHVLLSKKRPAATLAWIWSILLFPYLGALVYLLLGADQMKRKRLRRSLRADFQNAPPPAACLSPDTPASVHSLLRALSTINEIPLATATHARLLSDAAAFYPALKERISQARHHIHVEFFIWRDDSEGREFLDALIQAAQRGVAVRLLLDQIGCLGTPSKAFASLRAAGGQFAWFYSLPFGRHSRFLNLRNHRKLQIIDGQWAFIGGMNIGAEYAGKDPGLGPWHDTQLEVRGEVLSFLQEIFATDWYFATQERLLGAAYYPAPPPGNRMLCQVIAGGPDAPREPIPKSLVTLLNFASSRVWIATGYFAPDIPLLSALQICAARGVDVRLLVSEKSDHPYLVTIGRSYYEDLLRYGIRVFEYSKAIHHSKTLLIDQEWLMVGSANSDNRSMRLNFELNLLLKSPEQAKELEHIFETDFAESREILPSDFAARPLHRRILESALRPLAPLL